MQTRLVPILKLIFFPIITAVLVAGCTGTGSSNKAQFYPLADSPKTAVLVVRNTGYAGSAALVEVKVDGVIVGTLGEDEAISQEIQAGSHTISVRFKGLGGVGLNNVAKAFEVETGDKAYYSIELETGFFTNKLKLIGLTKDSFFE